MAVLVAELLKELAKGETRRAVFTVAARASRIISYLIYSIKRTCINLKIMH
jgi:hypothetical protein